MIVNKLNKKQMSGIFMLLIVLLLVLLVLTVLPQKKASQVQIDTKQVTQNIQNKVSVAVKPSIKSFTVANSTNAPIIHSYKGSTPDGAVNIDANGLIIIDHDLKRLFDYYFTATGELSIAQIKAQLKLFSQDNLNSFQVSELMNMFDQYNQYLNDYAKFTQMLSPDLSQAQRLALISDFRINKLGTDMANAFFAKEENYIKFVMSDTQADDGQWSEQQIAWLASENKATEYLDTIQENQIFNESQSMNTTEIYDYRAQQYGEQAALRLAQLDSSRNQWQQTLAGYNSQRQSIENNQSAMTLSQLHAQYSEQQVRRLSGLWRVKNDE